HSRCGRLFVADLPDHDHVGGLPQNVLQEIGEIDADLGADLRLPYVAHRVLDGVLDRVDLPRAGVEVLQTRIKRGRLAGAGWASHQEQTAGTGEQPGEAVVVVSRQAQAIERPQTEA